MAEHQICVARLNPGDRVWVQSYFRHNILLFGERTANGCGRSVIIFANGEIINHGFINVASVFDGQHNVRQYPNPEVSNTVPSICADPPYNYEYLPYHHPQPPIDLSSAKIFDSLSAGELKAHDTIYVRGFNRLHDRIEYLDLEVQDVNPRGITLHLLRSPRSNRQAFILDPRAVIEPFSSLPLRSLNDSQDVKLTGIFAVNLYKFRG